MAKKNKNDGEAQFHEFYESYYKERWPKILEAFKESKGHILLQNPHSTKQIAKELNLGHFADCEFLYQLNGEDLPAPAGDPLPYYFLDGASAYAPLALKVSPGDNVLDLCAAPGGKSLIMAFALKGDGHLTANDKSENRRFRLRRVLKDYLPEEFFESGIRVTGFDAGGWCLHEKEAYNKILLDAPCSSERHIFDSEQHLKDWRPGRTKRLAALQWTMLASAWLVLEKGGRLVYSTCSISPLENDGVVKKLAKKFKEECHFIFPAIPDGERSEFGTLLMPDKSGHGPFYLSVIEKR